MPALSAHDSAAGFGRTDREQCHANRTSAGRSREPVLNRPFAWTAGKTLFRWFEEFCGMNEAAVRSTIYFAAVCRCFPGKAPGGSDRVPAPDEIRNCSSWMNDEFEILRPRLAIPVGKLAIAQFIPLSKSSTQSSAENFGSSAQVRLSILSRCRILPALRRGTNFRPEKSCSEKPCAKSRASAIRASGVNVTRSAAVITGHCPVSENGRRLRVTVWGENVHEQENPASRKFIRRNASMHRRRHQENETIQVRTATLDEPNMA